MCEGGYEPVGNRGTYSTRSKVVENSHRPSNPTLKDGKTRTLNEDDDEKLGEVLQRMHDEDPTLLVEYSKELKQIIVYGQGEFHLNTMKWRIENNDKVSVVFNRPKIPYRETITKARGGEGGTRARGGEGGTRARSGEGGDRARGGEG